MNNTDKRIKRLITTTIVAMTIGVIGIAGFIYGATQGNAAYNSGWAHGIEYATEQANYVADTLCGQKEYELYSDLTWYCLADKEAE
jgi:F0F1-type ATP synthase membrane subunit a